MGFHRIRTQTGISLKEALSALDGRHPVATTKLRISARKTGLKDLEAEFNDEIVDRTRYCEKFKSESCSQSVETLRSQLEGFRRMKYEYSSLEATKKMLFDLTVYAATIKMRVLAKELIEWDRTCGSQEKINLPSCQNKLFETHVLIDIAEDLARVAASRSRKEKVDVGSIAKIKERIAKYEKF